MAISTIHGIHQNIPYGFLTKKFQCHCTSSFAIVSSHLHFQDYSTSIVDPFYCLQYNSIERSCKATLKQLIYLPGPALAKQCWMGTQGVTAGVNTVCEAH